MRPLLAALLFVPPLAAAETWSWSPVRIGGGGAVTDVVVHPRVSGLAYLTADVSGPSRWDEAAGRWTMLFTGFGPQDGHLFGTEALAIDPGDSSGNTVYAVAGAYAYSTGTKGEVLRSTDRGATWTRSGPMVWAASNWTQRRTARLAVDPTNPEVLWHASREGLRRTFTASTIASGWGLVAGAPTGLLLATTASADSGAVLIVLDPSQGGTGSPVRCRRAYLGVLNSDGSTTDLHATDDGGATWTQIDTVSGGPGTLYRAAIDGAGRLWVTHSAGVARWSGGTTGTWTDRTPATGAGYVAIAVDPTVAAGTTVVTSAHAWAFNQPWYRTTTDGAAWTAMADGTLTWQAPWYRTNFFRASTFALAYDPHQAGRLWLSDWYQPWRTEQAGTSPTAWSAKVLGHEQTVIAGSGLLCPPAPGPRLVSAVADHGGFAHSDPDAWPTLLSGTGKMSTQWNATGIAAQESNPARLVAVGMYGHDDLANTSPYTNAGTSSDGGATWTRISATIGGGHLAGGRVAITASGSRVVWATSQGVWYGDLPTLAWTKATGPADAAASASLWNWDQPLAADAVTAGRFYLYQAGKVWRSDGGAAWTAVASGLPTASNTQHTLLAAPDAAGRLWLRLNAQLRRSDDAGATWTQINAVGSVRQIGLGLQPDDSGTAVYALATVGGVEGLHRSDDDGATWTRIDDGGLGNLQGWTNAVTIAGDRQVPGAVYVSSNGSGILCGRFTANAAPVISAPASAAPAVLTLP